MVSKWQATCRNDAVEEKKIAAKFLGEGTLNVRLRERVGEEVIMQVQPIGNAKV
jgi:hypothetical protein